MVFSGTDRLSFLGSGGALGDSVLAAFDGCLLPVCSGIEGPEPLDGQGHA
jgi:hypothetical protein